MAAGTYAGVLSVFSVAGSSQLEFIENATLTVEEAQQEGAPASRFGGNIQGTKLRGRLQASLFSDRATDIRVSHLDLSAATIGAINLLSPNILAALELRIQMRHQMKPGTGQLWEHPQVVDGFFSAMADLTVESGTAPQLLIDMFSSTYADRNKVIDFTLNGVQVQVPFRATDASLPVTKDGLQTYSMNFADRSARSGVTVLPAGTTSLLQKAINAPKTAIAFALTPESANSIAVSGNMVWDSLTLRIEDGRLVPTGVSFLTQGTVTGAGN